MASSTARAAGEQLKRGAGQPQGRTLVQLADGGDGLLRLRALLQAAAALLLLELLELLHLLRRQGRLDLLHRVRCIRASGHL